MSSSTVKGSDPYPWRSTFEDIDEEEVKPEVNSIDVVHNNKNSKNCEVKEEWKNKCDDKKKQQEQVKNDATVVDESRKKVLTPGQRKIYVNNLTGFAEAKEVPDKSSKLEVCSNIYESESNSSLSKDENNIIENIYRASRGEKIKLDENRPKTCKTIILTHNGGQNSEPTVKKPHKSFLNAADFCETVIVENELNVSNENIPSLRRTTPNNARANSSKTSNKSHHLSVLIQELSQKSWRNHDDTSNGVPIKSQNCVLNLKLAKSDEKKEKSKEADYLEQSHVSSSDVSHNKLLLDASDKNETKIGKLTRRSRKRSPVKKVSQKKTVVPSEKNSKSKAKVSDLEEPISNGKTDVYEFSEETTSNDQTLRRYQSKAKVSSKAKSYQQKYEYVNKEVLSNQEVAEALILMHEAPKNLHNEMTNSKNARNKENSSIYDKTRNSKKNGGKKLNPDTKESAQPSKRKEEAIEPGDRNVTYNGVNKPEIIFKKGVDVLTIKHVSQADDSLTKIEKPIAKKVTSKDKKEKNGHSLNLFCGTRVTRGRKCKKVRPTEWRESKNDTEASTFPATLSTDDSTKSKNKEHQNSTSFLIAQTTEDTIASTSEVIEEPKLNPAEDVNLGLAQYSPVSDVDVTTLDDVSSAVENCEVKGCKVFANCLKNRAIPVEEVISTNFSQVAGDNTIKCSSWVEETKNSPTSSQPTEKLDVCALEMRTNGDVNSTAVIDPKTYASHSENFSPLTVIDKMGSNLEYSNFIGLPATSDSDLIKEDYLSTLDTSFSHYKEKPGGGLSTDDVRTSSVVNKCSYSTTFLPAPPSENTRKDYSHSSKADNSAALLSDQLTEGVKTNSIHSNRYESSVSFLSILPVENGSVDRSVVKDHCVHVEVDSIEKAKEIENSSAFCTSRPHKESKEPDSPEFPTRMETEEKGTEDTPIRENQNSSTEVNETSTFNCEVKEADDSSAFSASQPSTSTKSDIEIQVDRNSAFPVLVCTEITGNIGKVGSLVKENPITAVNEISSCDISEADDSSAASQPCEDRTVINIPEDPACAFPTSIRTEDTRTDDTQIMENLNSTAEVNECLTAAEVKEPEHSSASSSVPFEDTKTDISETQEDPKDLPKDVDTEGRREVSSQNTEALNSTGNETSEVSTPGSCKAKEVGHSSVFAATQLYEDTRTDISQIQDDPNSALYFPIETRTDCSQIEEIEPVDLRTSSQADECTNTADKEVMTPISCQAKEAEHSVFSTQPTQVSRTDSSLAGETQISTDNEDFITQLTAQFHQDARTDISQIQEDPNSALSSPTETEEIRTTYSQLEDLEPEDLRTSSPAKESTKSTNDEVITSGSNQAKEAEHSVFSSTQPRTRTDDSQVEENLNPPDNEANEIIIADSCQDQEAQNCFALPAVPIEIIIADSCQDQEAQHCFALPAVPIEILKTDSSNLEDIKSTKNELIEDPTVGIEIKEDLIETHFAVDIAAKSEVTFPQLENSNLVPNEDLIIETIDDNISNESIIFENKNERHESSEPPEINLDKNDLPMKSDPVKIASIDEKSASEPDISEVKPEEFKEKVPVHNLNILKYVEKLSADKSPEDSKLEVEKVDLVVQTAESICQDSAILEKAVSVEKMEEQAPLVPKKVENSEDANPNDEATKKKRKPKNFEKIFDKFLCEYFKKHNISNYFTIISELRAKGVDKIQIIQQNENCDPEIVQEDTLNFVNHERQAKTVDFKFLTDPQPIVKKQEDSSEKVVSVCTNFREEVKHTKKNSKKRCKPSEDVEEVITKMRKKRILSRVYEEKPKGKKRVDKTSFSELLQKHNISNHAELESQFKALEAPKNRSVSSSSSDSDIEIIEDDSNIKKTSNKPSRTIRNVFINLESNDEGKSEDFKFQSFYEPQHHSRKQATFHERLLANKKRLEKKEKKKKEKEIKETLMNNFMALKEEFDRVQKNSGLVAPFPNLQPSTSSNFLIPPFPFFAAPFSRSHRTNDYTTNFDNVMPSFGSFPPLGSGSWPSFSENFLCRVKTEKPDASPHLTDDLPSFSRGFKRKQRSNPKEKKRRK